MSTAQIVAAVVVGWIVLAAVLGLIVGRVIRNRDRRAPKPPHNEPAIPQQRKPRRHPQQWPNKQNGKH